MIELTKNEIICIELAAGRLDVVKALEDGKIGVDGDIEKALVLSDALKATVNKKSSELKKPATASKPATSKKATNKKAYIDGKKELREINMEFRASYVSGEIDKEEKRGCGYV